MSLVTFVLGSALNSPQFQTLMGLGPILTVNFQSDVSMRGVGPAVRRENFQRGADQAGLGSSGRRLNRGR